MPAQTGKTVLVRFRDDAGSPAFQTIGGLRTRSIQFNAETVDVTNATSGGAVWRELLDKTGVQSASVSGEGVFWDDAAIEAIRDAFEENEMRSVEFTVPGFGTFSGSFIVTALSISAEHNREVTFSTTFESAGAITFAAL